MKIAIIGAGGIGGYFGARLAASGEDVAFVARGAHLAAMKRDGLRLESARGNLHVTSVRATDVPAEIGAVDVVMIAVKLWDTEAAATAARPLVGPDTTVVSFQNGVDAAERIAAIIGPEHVVGGTAQIAVVIAAPGVIRHTGTAAVLTIGELGGGTSARVGAFVATGKRAGLDVVASTDMRRAIWEKFILLAPFAGVTTLTRQPKGPIFADADTRRLFVDAVGEAAAVARAAGVALLPDAEAMTVARAETLPPAMKASMLHDLERGARLELPWLSGAIVRLGEAHGVPTPTNRFIVAALKLYANGVPPAGG
jgi:2-dehydropantoate 2-reductase